MRKFLFIAIILPVLLGFISIPLLIPVAKSIRSQQHLNNALQYKGEKDHKGAFFKIVSAMNLAPEDPEVRKRLGPYGAAVNDPNTLKWWTAAAEDGLLELNSLIEMVEYGIGSGQEDQVQRFLFELSRDHPDNERVQALQVRFFRNKQRDTSALARNLVNVGNLDPAVLSSYVEGTFYASEVTAEEREAVIETLREAAGSETDVGIFSLRTLLRMWEFLKPSDKAILEQKLRLNPQATIVDQLFLLSLRKAEGADPLLILEEARSVYRKFREEAEEAEEAEESVSPTLTMVEWLNRENYPDAVLEYVPDAGAIEDSDLFFARQIGFIKSGDPEGARDSTLKDNPLTPSKNFVLRAFSQVAMDEQDNARSNLAMAIETVNMDEIQWLERVFIQAGDYRLVLDLYEYLEQQLANPLVIRLRLLPYYYQLGREDELRQIVRDIPLDTLSRSLPDQLSVLYFINLYRTDLPAARRQAEGLVSEYPHLFEPRIFLGFSYAVSGNPRLAMATIEGWENFDLRGNRSYAIMMAYILANNQQLDTARELISDIPVSSLMDLERALLRSLI